MLDSRGLPPGAYMAPDGQIMHRNPRLTARGEDEQGPWEEHEWQETHAIIGRPGDPTELREQQRRARSLGADFYHPTMGWLRRGIKRQQEWPQNLGSTVKPRERTRTRVVTHSEPEPEIQESVEVLATNAPGAEGPPLDLSSDAEPRAKRSYTRRASFGDAATVE